MTQKRSDENMATPFLKVYDAFLARITADEWTLEEELAIVERDWQELLKMAIARFKYPRVSLEFEEVSAADIEDSAPQLKIYQFKNDLTNAEIQVLATIMKHEWIRRCVASWEHIGTLYTSKDFSAANHLDKLNDLESNVRREVDEAIDIYDKSRGNVPATIFRQLAGKRQSY